MNHIQVIKKFGDDFQPSLHNGILGIEKSCSVKEVTSVSLICYIFLVFIKNLVFTYILLSSN